MKIYYEFANPNGNIGTIAHVHETIKSWFKTKAVTTTYICVRGGGMMHSATWVNSETGKEVNWLSNLRLERALNEVAQAALRVKAIKESGLLEKA